MVDFTDFGVKNRLFSFFSTPFFFLYCKTGLSVFDMVRKQEEDLHNIQISCKIERKVLLTNILSFFWLSLLSYMGSLRYCSGFEVTFGVEFK